MLSGEATNVRIKLKELGSFTPADHSQRGTLASIAIAIVVERAAILQVSNKSELTLLPCLECKGSA